MKATSFGSSSCSDGKNAGPRLRRELLFGLPTALARTAPAADVDAMFGDAMASRTPSTGEGLAVNPRWSRRRIVLTLILQLEFFLLEPHQTGFQPPLDTFQGIDFRCYFLDFDGKEILSQASAEPPQGRLERHSHAEHANYPCPSQSHPPAASALPNPTPFPRK